MSKNFNGTTQSTVVKAIFELWSSNPIIRYFFYYFHRLTSEPNLWLQMRLKLKMFVVLFKFHINFSLIIIIQVKGMQQKIKENQSHFRQRDSERYRKKKSNEKLVSGIIWLSLKGRFFVTSKTAWCNYWRTLILIYSFCYRCLCVCVTKTQRHSIQCTDKCTVC